MPLTWIEVVDLLLAGYRLSGLVSSSLDGQLPSQLTQDGSDSGVRDADDHGVAEKKAAFRR